MTPRSRQAEALRVILALRPRYLRVSAIAAVLSISRRTFTRLFGSAGLPSPQAWIGLVRALHTHRAILKGRRLKEAAIAAGYPDQFTMSNALHRMTGFRPSALRGVAWTQLVDAWIARQQHRGTLVRRLADRLSEPPTPP
ncbi:MAG: helix-turn-helix domain-containing protein [Longimicrobiales bacterium]